MKNPGKTVRAAVLLLVLCMISTAMMGGTFAKYTSEYAGADTALVARWQFEALDDPDNGMAQELEFFDHLYDTHINPTDGAADPKFILAPGVEDEFTVKMDYIADVDADVVIEITPLTGNAVVPMEYSVDDGDNWVTLAGLADALAEQIKTTNVGGKISVSDPDADGSFRIAAVDTDSVDDINISETVKWRWPYEAKADVVAGSTNATDTELGEASQAAAASDTTKRTTYGININITATQVTPTT
jgi:hypothetical protein